MRKIFIAGIDEAGRGPILGPLVIAGVLANKEQEEMLIEMGVKDSKELKPATRKKLAEKIKKTVEAYSIIKITASELNELMPRKSLNEIEAMKTAQILDELKPKPDIAIVDAPDIIEENYAKRIRKYLCASVVIKSEHFADSKYPIVGAASILAKVERDAEIDELKKEFGNIGSGYWHDEDTKNFVEAYIKSYNKLPPFARIYWEPSVRMLNEKRQKKLLDFTSSE